MVGIKRVSLFRADRLPDWSALPQNALLRLSAYTEEQPVPVPGILEESSMKVEWSRDDKGLTAKMTISGVVRLDNDVNARVFSDAMPWPLVAVVEFVGGSAQVCGSAGYPLRMVSTKEIDGLITRRTFTLTGKSPKGPLTCIL